MSDFSLEAYFAAADFALATGGIAIDMLVRPPRAKRRLIVTVLVFLVLSCGLQWEQEWSRRRQVRIVADEIVGVLGGEKRTYDDIADSVHEPDRRLVDAALDLLLKEKRLESEETTITDKADEQFRVRLYFVRSGSAPTASS
jgi:hypothetical protein